MSDFIWIKRGAHETGAYTFPVVELSQEEAEEYAELAKENFVEHWLKLRREQWERVPTKS